MGAGLSAPRGIATPVGAWVIGLDLVGPRTGPGGRFDPGAGDWVRAFRELSGVPIAMGSPAKRGMESPELGLAQSLWL